MHQLRHLLTILFQFVGNRQLPQTLWQHCAGELKDGSSVQGAGKQQVWMQPAGQPSKRWQHMVVVAPPTGLGWMQTAVTDPPHYDANSCHRLPCCTPVTKRDGSTSKTKAC